jgi:hypothetical protein
MQDDGSLRQSNGIDPLGFRVDRIVRSVKNTGGEKDDT